MPTINVPGVSIVPAAAVGSGLTITGTGFGEKVSVTNKPYFEDFESYATGTFVAKTSEPLYHVSNAPTAPNTTIVSTAVHSGSKCVKHQFGGGGSGGEQNFPKHYIKLSEGQRKGYFSSHIRFSGAGTGASQVWKLGMVGYPAGNEYGGQPNGIFSYTAASSTTVPTNNGGDEIWNSAPTLIGYAGISTSDTTWAAQTSTNTWCFVEYWWDLGSVDVADWYFRCDVNNGTVGKYDAANNASLTGAWRLSAEELPGWFITPINGLSSVSGDIAMQQDDLCVDEAWNRVVMTDNATYANSSKWAIQPVTSWSATSINCDARRQGFAINDTAYLHVFDADDVLVHTTGAITVGADS